MNDLEAELHYPLGEALPALGATLEVAPGVRWVRMALPFALNHINLWLLRDCLDGVEGWSIVDCCIHRDEAKAQWESIFANELQGLPILRVIVTHMHPDHIGLAHWLCERWNVKLWISATDYQIARLGCMGPTGFGGDRAAAYFASHGLNSPEAVEQIKARTGYFPSLVPSVPPSYRRLMDGMVLTIGGRAWRCISGYGHAPEHMALYCDELEWAPKVPTAPAPQGGARGLGAARRPRGVLIGGDMMLPRISTNVSVYEQEPETDSLKLFLDSIDKFRSLPEDTLVLPSHGKPFTGLHTRIQQLHDHHRERLAEMMQACTERPCSAADVLPVLFKRELDLHQTTFAMGESVAHLHALWFAGRLERRLGVDGVYRFGVSAAG